VALKSLSEESSEMKGVSQEMAAMLMVIMAVMIIFTAWLFLSRFNFFIAL